MVANALIELAPADLKLGIVEIGQLQLYNQDLDDQPPAEWTVFRERIAGSNAVLFVTPEYNRSIPAALKNALDVGSRPYGKSVWNGKPGAVVSASPSAIGGFGANQHLRQTFVFLNIPAMQQPEAYLQLRASIARCPMTLIRVPVCTMIAMAWLGVEAQAQPPCQEYLRLRNAAIEAWRQAMKAPRPERCGALNHASLAAEATLKQQPRVIQYLRPGVERRGIPARCGTTGSW